VLTAVASVSEVIVIFSANSVCKHSCVLLLSARISLTLFCEGDSGEKISMLGQKDQSLTRFLACFKKPTSWLFMSVALSYKVSFVSIGRSQMVLL